MPAARLGWRVVLPVCAVALALAAAGLGALVAPPKAFALPRVAIDATLEPDGTLAVVEHLTYDFTGRFSYGTRPIPLGSYEITDMTVSENGSELTSVGAPYNLQWFFTADDERRTFDVAYRVHGVTAVGPDVAELYWKWVGEDHPEIDAVVATLHLPPGSAGTRAWGHGPLSGNIRVRDDRAVWRAPDVPRGSFVEGRVAVPTAALRAPVTTEPRLPRILGEERAAARAANAARLAARRDAEHEDQLRDAATFVVPLVVLIAAAVFVVLFVRFGREPAVPDLGEYVRDLPDDPPAMVDTLLHWGSVRPEALSGTLLDLARRGHLTIRDRRTDRWLLPDTVDYELERAPDADTRDVLTDYEDVALDIVFGRGSPTRQSDLTAWARANPKGAKRQWESFRKKATTAYDALRYQHRGRGRVVVANVLAASAAIAAGALALVVRGWVVGAIGIAWGTVQLCLTPVLRQRTPTGAHRAAEWRGVARFLADFSRLEDAPVGHLVLWERYLVAAVVLGVADKLLEGLRARVPDTEGDGVGVRWYAGTGSAGWSSLAGIGGLGHGLGPAFVAAATPSSSSSGGGHGGGFSGGGGGGGGGGGIGAG